jgi:hypothetical protein
MTSIHARAVLRFYNPGEDGEVSFTLGEDDHIEIDALSLGVTLVGLGGRVAHRVYGKWRVGDGRYTHLSITPFVATGKP